MVDLLFLLHQGRGTLSFVACHTKSQERPRTGETAAGEVAEVRVQSQRSPSVTDSYFVLYHGHSLLHGQVCHSQILQEIGEVWVCHMTCPALVTWQGVSHDLCCPIHMTRDVSHDLCCPIHMTRDVSHALSCPSHMTRDVSHELCCPSHMVIGCNDLYLTSDCVIGVIDGIYE